MKRKQPWYLYPLFPLAALYLFVLLVIESAMMAIGIALVEAGQWLLEWTSYPAWPMLQTWHEFRQTEYRNRQGDLLYDGKMDAYVRAKKTSESSPLK